MSMDIDLDSTYSYSSTTIGNSIPPENSVEKGIKIIENTLQQGIIKKRIGEMYARLENTEDRTKQHLIKLEAQLYSKILKGLVEDENVLSLTDPLSITVQLPNPVQLSGISSGDYTLINSQGTKFKL